MTIEAAMTIHLAPHADDRALELLVHGAESSPDFQQAAAHVEDCPLCQERLDQLTGSAEFMPLVREMLSGTDITQLNVGNVSVPGGDPSSSHVYLWPTGDRPIFADEPAESESTPTLEFLSPPSHPEMLGRLGRYEIEKVIGSGGMGVVLKAFDTELHRPVAIKVLARHLAHSGAARARFAREAKAAAAVVHEHVVAIHTVETAPRTRENTRDVPFLVMQFIAGESLQARVERNGPLTVKEILRIGAQAAAGLAAAHEQGLVHRDIKPANILLENGVERVLLTDFGLARTVDDASLTNTGIVAGTPHYMSPEQANGDATDQRTDLFSLGAVLYFMATGRPPFRAERAMGVLHRIVHDRQRPVWQINPEIPDELSDLIDNLLEKRPARRIPSAVEARSRLLAQLESAQNPRRPWLRAARQYLRRQQRALVGSAALAACLLIVAAWWWNGLDKGVNANTDTMRKIASQPTRANPTPSAEKPDVRIGNKPLQETAKLSSLPNYDPAGLLLAPQADAEFAAELAQINARLQTVTEPAACEAIPCDTAPLETVELQTRLRQLEQE
ncbi:MAG: serine/threonine-protein kinase [Pirellulales bacterium]|nr:serine/threonine-protein kinase [Pirellulales bacterium]